MAITIASIMRGGVASADGSIKVECPVAAPPQQGFQSPLSQDIRERQARRVAQQIVVERLLKLADDPQVASDARAMVNLYLKQLSSALQSETDSTADDLDQAHAAYLVDQIDRFGSRSHQSAASLPTVELPPGSPIGAN